MSYFTNNTKGFSLVEILGAIIILAIAVAGSLGFFASIAKLRIASDNELEAFVNASTWLEHIRTGERPAIRYNALIPQTGIDLNHAVSIFPEDYANEWPLAYKNKSKIVVPSPGGATYTVEEGINLGSGYNFKLITVEVKWQEISSVAE